MTALLQGENISVSLGGRTILKRVNFRLDPGEILMIVGPNGSGKTTLVRAMMGVIPSEGQVHYEGQDLKDFSLKERARRIGVLTQSNAVQFAYKVEEVVALGRYIHGSGLSAGLNAADRSAIDRALAMTRTEELRFRAVTTLSGGELQRVCLARVLAQEPEVLILDEPTNHLDIEHQLMIFQIIRDWTSAGRHAAIAIVHDLNLVYAYGTRAMLLNRGEVYASGNTKEVLSSENLKEVYHVDLVAWMQSLLAHWR